MAFVQYALVANSAPPAKRMSDVYGDGAGVVNARNDIPFRQLVFQADPANGGPVYIGDSDLTAPDNAAFVLQPTVDKLAAITLGPFDSGPMRLSDFYIVGSGGTPRVFISGVPF
jgi:hypothetical protein